MVLFWVAVKGQVQHPYSRADVAVSYVLLVGAITLEASSYIVSMFTRQDLWSHPVLCSCVQLPAFIHCVFFSSFGPCAVRLRRWRPPQQWSETLAQYSLIGRSAEQASGSGWLSLVPRCIVERLRASGFELDTASTEHIPVTDGLKLFVIKKLLDADAMLKDSEFTGSRGELALGKWMGSLEVPAERRSETLLRESLRDVDFPTSVLVWHIATDMCFFNVDAATATATTAAAATASTTDPDHEKKIISRQLSNYIMYIIFKCGVMLTSNSKFLLGKANDEIIHLIDAAGKDNHHHQQQQQQQGDPDPKGINGRQREKVAVERLAKSALFQDIARELSAGADAAAPFNPSDTEVLSDPVLPRAFKVAAALAGIREAGVRWDLIAAVWLEMLYYVATRCGAAFHREHLSTGGELVTHVLVLMYIIGPLGYHPSVLTETNT